MKKIKERINRYLFPTLLSVFFSLFLGLGLKAIFHEPLITALGGTWGDNIGFYGLIFYRDIKERKKIDKKITFLSVLKVIRNAIAEFGIAEYLDSFIIRPAFMLFFPQLLHNDVLGILVAKFAADITFFLPTVIFYEIRKRVFRD